MKKNIILIFMLGFLAFTLALTPVEASPTRSGMVESGPPVLRNNNLPGIQIANIGPNMDIFNNPNPQNEPSIAINQVNNNILAAGANDYTKFNPEVGGNDGWAGYYYSIDAGASWRNGLIPFSGNLARYNVSGDPWLSFDGANTAYYSGIAFNRNTAPNAVFVAKSINGGATYSDPVIVENTTDPNIFHDKPWNAVDGNNVYVTWTRFDPIASPIVFKRSTNGGASFDPIVAVSDPPNNQDQGSQVAVGPGGVIYAAWEHFFGTIQNPQYRILFDKSTNGGVSFGGDTQVTTITEIHSPLPNKGFRVNSFPYMAVDKNNGNIYITWNDNRSGNSDILFVRSINGGTTWSAPIKVNDDSTSNDQFFPAISVDQSNGKINIVFYDTRNDPGNHMMDLYYAESTDGGLTFYPNQRVTTTSFNPNNDGFDGGFIGDYIGLGSGTKNHHPVWTDTRTGNADIFTSILISNGPPSITGFAPLPPVNNTEGQSRTFNITVNQTVNVTWYINGSQVQYNTSVTNASYTNTSAAAGSWNVTAVANNTNGTASQQWLWNVTAATGTTDLTVFVHGSDNAVWYRNRTAGAWNPYQSLGGVVASNISATSSGSNITTFVRGTDNALWTQNWNGGSWSGWQPLGEGA